MFYGTVSSNIPGRLTKGRMSHHFNPHFPSPLGFCGEALFNSRSREVTSDMMEVLLLIIVPEKKASEKKACLGEGPSFYLMIFICL